MKEAQALLPAIVGGLAAALGCVLGLVVGLMVPAGPGWVRPLLMIVFGLGLGAVGGVTTRRKLRPVQSKP